MAPIQNVAILGGTGSLGEVLVPELLKAEFNVTCITRPGSKAILPKGVITKSADYTDHKSLTAALENQDALVEAFNPAASAHQELILKSASAAGVRHIITPDFSGDTFHPRISELLIFEPKLRAKRQLETIIAQSEGKLTWTAIITGPWFDWTIETGIFWVNKEKRTIYRYGSGDQKCSMSRRALNGEALVAVLKNPERFQNRPAYFASHTVSTNELIAVVKELGLEGWSTVDVPIKGHHEEALRLWEEDSANGVEDRLGSKAYPMLSTVALLNEENRYGADFSQKVEPGWDEGKDALKESLKKLLSS
ncbi:hypothetical protein NM208_g9233 [Fusarium decemcellulare]|uniref:Uncharacterized protein n=1 Tax=Fusarium decemcellulare TaxID=57161 RepID=A0ACC1S2B7_9HYPO|nr:hypothetical protein NM208_g9233 [Fusarium decemcellulare]